MRSGLVEEDDRGTFAKRRVIKVKRKEKDSIISTLTETVSDSSPSKILTQIPLSSENFEKIIKKQMVYVDKTDIIETLLQQGPQDVLITRPRRFGKSLVLDIIGNVLEGKKELFVGLKIFEMRREWKKHAVFRFNFAVNSNLNQAVHFAIRVLMLESGLDDKVKDTGHDGFDQVLEYFMNARLTLKHHLGMESAILIDEYDFPIVRFLDTEKVGEQLTEQMRENSEKLQLLFNSIHNDNSRTISHIIVTGVATFAKYGFFSTANPIQDYSFSSDIATLYGYTSTEVLTYFRDHLEALSNKKEISVDDLMKQIIEQHNRYCFSFENSSTVLNPYDINKLLAYQCKDYYSY